MSKLYLFYYFSGFLLEFSSDIVSVYCESLDPNSSRLG